MWLKVVYLLVRISSSSALISGLAYGLIINNLQIGKNEIVDIVSDVEHNYIGLKEIMDQFPS